MRGFFLLIFISACVSGTQAGNTGPLTHQNVEMSRPQALSAPDMVQLKNGGVYRGTIAELVPDDKVVMVLITGDTREFMFAEVQYAGPAVATEEPPSSAANTIRVSRPLTLRADNTVVPLRLESSGNKLSFYLRVDSLVSKTLEHGKVSAAGYQLICVAPCEVNITRGTHVFALSPPKKPTTEADEPVTITGPGTLRGNYTSWGWARAIGQILGTGTSALAAVYLFTGDGGLTSPDQGRLLGALLIGAAGGLVLSLAKYIEDDVDMVFEPSS